MKACVLTLGCKLNEVESASLMRGLEEEGYETTETLSYADIYLINTCAVTAEAERKSRQAVARVRKFNPAAPVIVLGCASQNNPQAFSSREGVTFVAGAQGKDKVLSLLRENARGEFCAEENAFCELPAPKRVKTRAFLRIQDGCNRFCSYCLIPYLRGRSRSRSAESIVKEAAACGAKEIVLTGVDASSYRDGETDLGGLLTLLGRVPARIRLGSLEPGAVTEEFLCRMKEAGNVAPHFHLSLQSGSSKILRAMNRKYTREEYLEKCALIYRAFPDAAITTDIIAGFPGETEEDFAQSLSIIREAGFARIHAFPFSPRKGTAAAKLPDLPAEAKKERTARLIGEGAKAEEKYLLRFLGREETVLFEEDGGYTGNYIRVYAEGAREGSLCRVRLLNRERDGLSAEIIEEI
ncbi:MAG: tRNA (N(6)-L-threonylcarbamoyladenosine(37)-C(2))-methylthiotransferase MtaB [Candidatus Gallimonas sp.]